MHHDTMAEAFKDRSMLYVYCVDAAARTSIEISSIPCFRYNVLLGHCSFPDMQRRRLIVLFPDTENVRQKLIDLNSPAVIDIKTSCLVKVKRCYSVFVLFVKCY